jgi:hypothetical protein
LLFFLQGRALHCALRALYLFQSPSLNQPSARASIREERRLTSKGEMLSSVVKALEAMVNIQKTKKASV